MNLDLNKVITLDYWLDPSPGQVGVLFLIAALSFSTLLLLGSLIGWYLSSRKLKNDLPRKNFLNKVLWTVFTLSLVSFTLTFFRYANLPWVSFRVLWPILVVILVGLAGFYWYWYRRTVPAQLQKIKIDQVKKKYFRPSKAKKTKKR